MMAFLLGEFTDPHGKTHGINEIAELELALELRFPVNQIPLRDLNLHVSGLIAVQRCYTATARYASFCCKIHFIVLLRCMEHNEPVATNSWHRSLTNINFRIKP